MLQFYNKLNISKKLDFMNLSTALIAGIIAIIFIVLYQYIDGTKILKYQSRTLAKVLAQNIAPALLFKDAKNIDESLSSVKYAENILEAYALDVNGNILGVYVQKQPYKKNNEIEKMTLKEEQFSKGFELYTVVPVHAENRTIGYLVLVHSTQMLITHLLTQTLFITLIILVSIIITSRYYKLLSRKILNPIAKLNKGTTKIIQTKTLHTHVRVYNDDEIGELAKNFNIMINTLSEYHEELNRQKDLLDYKANHDDLTDLPNRALFNDRLAVAMKKADRNKSALGVFFLDIDYFKQINDQYGHDVGDELLKRFSQRLQECLRAADTLARIGGDEFMIILEENKEMTTSKTVAKKIVEAMKEPIALGESTLKISTSIGIAIYPQDAKDAEELVKNADMAMYKVKESGRDGFAFFQAE
ncbi:sensor domain-containing diguanylate cyclase [Sulfurimonas paralvinellae]|uniref:Diguanylate cyclase n=1 Tax=Sulfurimonas paralvinellae TaxID=317658 RepID=A0A7M1B862_9BACT|nr:sensor domain-containing diguanylate cyclase [Sulfurimonas paralvinellae]QOP45636.1 diguanylate cyclase [Sulfurimonas paralvinellae]